MAKLNKTFWATISQCKLLKILAILRKYLRTVRQKSFVTFV
jgi:hypothetical protein